MSTQYGNGPLADFAATEPVEFTEEMRRQRDRVTDEVIWRACRNYCSRWEQGRAACPSPIECEMVIAAESASEVGAEPTSAPRVPRRIQPIGLLGIGVYLASAVIAGAAIWHLVAWIARLFS